jgi:type VI secretion system protein ImpH
VSYWDELAKEPWRFDLLDLMRRLERENPEKPRIGDAATPAEEVVEVTQPPYLEFPASNVTGFSHSPGKPPRVAARFLGMFGPQGALPLTTTLQAYLWQREDGDDALARFVDLFQRRFLSLFFRAWADAHPITQHDRPKQDRFRAYLGSMIGVGTPAFDDAGLLAPRVKSASRLRDFLTALLNVRVEIQEFVGSWLALEPTERTRLGATNSRLGRDTIIGSSVFTVSDKFRIRIYAEDAETYRSFLPLSPRAIEIADAVYLYVGQEFEWELELAIPAGQVEPVRLGGASRLGWTAWMSPNWADDDRSWRTDARFDVVSRQPQSREARSSLAAQAATSADARPARKRSTPRP